MNKVRQAFSWILTRLSPSPRRWARVHMLGRRTYVGEVFELGAGAFLVKGVDLKTNPPQLVDFEFRSEAAGRFGIEYMTAEGWTSYQASLVKQCADWRSFEQQQRDLAERRRQEPKDESSEGSTPRLESLLGRIVDALTRDGFDLHEILGEELRKDVLQAIGFSPDSQCDDRDELDEDDIPSDAVEEALAANTIERLGMTVEVKDLLDGELGFDEHACESDLVWLFRLGGRGAWVRDADSSLIDQPSEWDAIVDAAEECSFSVVIKATGLTSAAEVKSAIQGAPRGRG